MKPRVRQYEGLFLQDVSSNDYSRVLNPLPLIVKLSPPFAPDKQQGKIIVTRVDNPVAKN